MNLVAFGLILICCHAWAIEIDDNFPVAGTYGLKTKLKDILEKFKLTVQDGDSSLGIPPLDPFKTDKLPIKLDEKNLTLDALLTNVKVDGLSSYIVNSADFKLLGLKLNIDLTWPSVTVKTNYSMNGDVTGIHLYGNGGIDATVHDFRFIINVSFTLKGKYVQIKKTDTKISLKSLDFRITGFLDDDHTSEMVSQMVSSMVPKLIDEQQKLICDNVNQIIKEKANDYLSTIPLKDLLKKIGL